MWKLLLFASAIAAPRTIDAGDDSALRGHMANLVRLARHRGDRPRLTDEHEITFNNGSRLKLAFLPEHAVACQPESAAAAA